MSDEQKEFKYTYVGKVVVRDGKNEETGEEFQYMSLQLGNRRYYKGEKKGQLIPPISLSEEQEKNLLETILSKDLFVFNPKEGAPSFIKKYIAVKTEDLNGESGKASSKKSENDDF